MTRPRKKRQGKIGTGMLIWCVLSIVMGVSLTTFHIWKKVELSYIARCQHGAIKQMALLSEDRVKLVAAIRARNKPGLIQRKAQEELGMVYPTGRLVLTGAGYDDGPQ